MGIDLVEICRIEHALSEWPSFRDRVFHPNEIARSEGSPARARSYALCFAAKEALLKALGTGAANISVWSRIGLRTEGRSASIELSGDLAASVRRLGVNAVHVAVAESAAFVVAMVILEGER